DLTRDHSVLMFAPACDNPSPDGPEAVSRSRWVVVWMRGMRAGKQGIVGAVVVALVASVVALVWAPAASAATSYAVTATIATGRPGNAVAVDPGTRTAYVVNSGANTVTAIDTSTN